MESKIIEGHSMPRDTIKNERIIIYGVLKGKSYATNTQI